jgi:hypothetical protein
MNYRLVQERGLAVVECSSGITDFRDSMALAYACGDADTDLLLIDAAAFPPEFFQLRTGFAGEFVQRLVNFRLRTAAVFAVRLDWPQRFREFLREARRSPQFRVFDDRDDALAWLAARPTGPAAQATE